MNLKCTLRLPAMGRAFCAALLLLGSSVSTNAQISLVKWENFFFGPPVPATSYLAMNNGKELTNSGQSSAFVSDAGGTTGAQFIANGWAIGNYYQANFSTTNYSTNTLTFFLGAYQFGAKNFKLQYAVGTPTSFTDFGSTITFPGAGGEGNYTYNLPAACNNQTNVYIRIVATSASNGGGGNYWDNVEVKGVAMTAPSITSQPSNATTCEGANASFTVVASNAISYQWQFRTSVSGTFANVPNNAEYNNETTATLQVVGSGNSNKNGYQYRCVVTGGTTPDATSNPATLTVNFYGTWNGSANSSWNNTANWDCGQVPTATTNVTISNVGTPPQVNINNAVCNNLTINAGATLIFAAGTNVLDIKGTVLGPGTLNGSAGKVIFSGTGAQNIPAGTYKDLQMNGAGAKTLGGNATVAGVMTFTNGTITLGSNNLTLTSTGTVSGGNLNSFVVTNSTGQLVNQGIGAGGKAGNILFPIGSATTSYTPVIFNNATGTLDNFSMIVKNGAFTSYSGTTGTGAISNNVVNKTWFISEGTAGGSIATVQLNWNESEEMGTFNRNSCCVSHYTNSAWSAGPLGLAGGVDPYNISRSGITSFSPFGVGSAGSPLPLDLISFTGRKTKDATELNWITTNEKSVKHFDIERSIDGDKFGAIGTVAAKNAREKNTYSYTDKNAPAAALYYRLKMTDVDGASNYSTVVRIANTGNGMSILFPNPVKEDVLNVMLNDQVTSDVVVSITDMYGKTVYTRKMTAGQVNSNVIPVSVKALAAGNYLLRIGTANGSVISRSRFVKQ